MGTETSPKLTKGQRAFFTAVATGARGMFHRSVVEPIEGLPYGKPGGLVSFTGRYRVVGCNSLAAGDFILSAEGRAALAKSPTPEPQS